MARNLNNPGPLPVSARLVPPFLTPLGALRARRPRGIDRLVLLFPLALQGAGSPSLLLFAAPGHWANLLNGESWPEDWRLARMVAEETLASLPIIRVFIRVVILNCRGNFNRRHSDIPLGSAQRLAGLLALVFA